MSASTATTERPARRQRDAEPAPASTAASTSAPSAPTVVSIIDGNAVNLPIKFSVGAVLTEAQASILNAAYARQFASNQTANVKARAERFGKATTDAEKAENAPLTAEDFAKIWANYEPQVGGGTRLGTMERMRLDAAWRFWVELVTAHNKAVAAGAEPVIAKAGKQRVEIGTAPRKTSGETDETHKARVEAFHSARDAFKARILTISAYADGVQRHLDAMIAEKGAAKAEKAAEGETVVASDSLL